MLHEALSRDQLNALAPPNAAAYFLMRRAEGLTASEQRLLADWLAAGPAHRDAYEGAERAWQSLANSKDDEILAAMRAHALAVRPKSRLTWWPAAAAAAALLGVFGAWQLLGPVVWRPGQVQNGSASLTAIQYEATQGAVKQIQLPDGSTMTLDAESTAVGHFGDRVRSVQLQRGRAFFSVHPDHSRPFTVAAATQTVVAVGTQFDVNETTDGLTVTLLEGRVDITPEKAKAASVSLQPGQQYVTHLGQTTIRMLGAAAEDAASWRVGIIKFDDQAMAEAVAQMNRYSQEKIVINDPSIAAMRVSGQFHAGDTAHFAETLAEMHQLQALRTGNQIELVRQP